MSTYEEFMIIINVAILIVAILTYTHKKQRPGSGKVRRYFHSNYFARTDRLNLSSGCLVKHIICQIESFVKLDFDA